MRVKNNMELQSQETLSNLFRRNLTGDSRRARIGTLFSTQVILRSDGVRICHGAALFGGRYISPAFRPQLRVAQTILKGWEHAQDF